MMKKVAAPRGAHSRNCVQEILSHFVLSFFQVVNK